MSDPKFKIGDKVHINGTSGVGEIILVERIAKKYLYHVEYPRGESNKLRKQCYEENLIKVN